MSDLKPTIYGWGIKDVDYVVQQLEKINGKSKIVWFCPYYRKWRGILSRCLCPKYQEKYPSYKGCTISEEWRQLSNFIKWVDSQPNRDWQNCEPDKDFLSDDNKHYGPETVVFVTKKVNMFIIDHNRARGDYMIGVCSSGRVRNPYQACCRNPFNKNIYIGLFATEIEAHKAWQAKKHEYACMLADLQDDPRVAKVLRERYAPDKDWTKV